MLLRFVKASLLLIEDMIYPVYHDLRNRFVLDKLLQHVQLAHGMEQLLLYLASLLKCQKMFSCKPPRMLFDQLTNLLVSQLPRQIHLLQNLPAQSFYVRLRSHMSPPAI